jgi:hypothetical protein
MKIEIDPGPMRKSLSITYDKISKSIQVACLGLCESRSVGRTCVSIIGNEASGERSEIEAAKRSKGIIVFNDASGVRILNDPFCTIPLYYTETTTHFYASSDPQELIDYRTHSYDPVGVWETLLLHSPLWNRTPYKDIKFLPSACELKLGNESTLQRYWKFEFESASTDFNQHTFFRDFDELINQKFADIQADTVCMGLSGGNDSRLAAHYLARNKHRFSEIKLVTYAAHPNSNEFRFASEVARALGLEAPHLHILKSEHYYDALNYLPQWSVGQINNLHCHLSSYLKEANSSGSGEIHLSTYYTDAIFGFACGKPESLNQIDHASAYQDIKNASFISDSIRAAILDDLLAALIQPDRTQSGFSSLDEIKYVVERNPRFHLSLAFVQHQFMSTVLPFADIDILEVAMKAPISLRANKGVLTKLLTHINPRLSSIRSSANTEYFYGVKSRLRNGTLLERAEFWKFRLLNMTMQVLSKLSDGDLKIGNPYQTEDQNSVYRSSFSHLVPAVLANEGLRECLGGEVIGHMLKDDLILRNLAERFSLICFHHLSKSK